MTTCPPESVVCASCGQRFTQNVVASTMILGSPDLDMRPAEMMRSEMRPWIQRCPRCGYCAPDVTKFDNRFRGVMAGAAYRSQLTDTRYPDLASTFICAAMLSEEVGRCEDTGWAYLHAAWALDDAAGRIELASLLERLSSELAVQWGYPSCDAKMDGLAGFARSCRAKAADVFLVILAGGHRFAKQPGLSEAILTDCLRRAGRGDEALPVIERALSQGYADSIQKLLTFQRSLIKRGDTSRHGIKEALENKPLS